MSDHIDGPRQIGDPSVDLTDLFAFTSPEDPARMVFAVNAFPSAGATALFSNACDYTLSIRPAAVVGLGAASKFRTSSDEYRFTCRFEVLEPGPDGRPVQHGTCTLPGGQQLRFVVDDEDGATTDDGVFRIFAGLRSDPFLLAWVVGKDSLTPCPNLLQLDNVLSIVLEFDTQRVLNPQSGSLFAAVAETTPVPSPPGLLNLNPHRFDWIGRPEQTNLRLNNPGLVEADDLRDLWNQQTPFAIREEFKPIFRRRLKDSLENYDMRDGKADWSSEEIAASVEVFLDDFLLFDVHKPITDTSFLEIEKSTLNGVAYETGGGRTIDTHDFDILLTWLVNRDRGPFMQGGAASATKAASKSFPYLASPNAQLQTVVTTVNLLASPEPVWALIGDFGGMWHPLIAHIDTAGTGIGQVRTIETVDGKRIVERLESMDPGQRSYGYSLISGIPAADYTGMLDVKPHGTGCSVQWRIQYWADGQPDAVVKAIVTTLEKVGLEGLKARFGSAAP
ncbi:putative secreted protein [Mesorhizobium sp. SOD10]|nr:putative secreted protein [Mesorhizobium sp. SOD10]